MEHHAFWGIVAMLRQEIPMPVAIGIIVVVLLVAGFFLYRVLFAPAPAVGGASEFRTPPPEAIVPPPPGAPGPGMQAPPGSPTQAPPAGQGTTY
ncbi:MAG: hypothetical protein ABDI19_03295 [Armatimonadota bacterium]